MADSKEDVASQALARLGEPSISSFDEDSDAAEKVNRLYEPTVLSLFSSYNWKFATTRKALSEDAAGVPLNEWIRGFLMPPLRTDRVGNPLMVFNSTRPHARPVFDYELEDRWILTNENVCVISYIRRTNESQWPGYFVELAVEALASRFALPITENQGKEEHHERVAYGNPSEKRRGGLMGAAMAADAQGNPTPSLLDDFDVMASARFGGGTGGGYY